MLFAVRFYTKYRTILIMAVLLTVAFILALLVGNELWWRKRKPQSELSRKFIHIAVGSFVAFWPFWLGWNEIRFLGAAFLIAVVVSKYLGVFRAIHSVQRPTWGEVCFALAVGSVTLITQDKWIYAASLLQMALADGIAALAGTRYGERNSYVVLGHTKSMVGTGAFIVVSYTILLSYSIAIVPVGIVWCLAVAVGAAILENFAVYGLDNLLVPLFVASMLSLVS